MRIAVCIKGTESAPADRAALEVGMGIRHRLAGVRIEAFSVCEPTELEPLYLARARGADAVHRIVPPSRWRGHSATALALATRLCDGGAPLRFGPSDSPFDLVLCGDRAPGEAPALVGELLAELLELTPVTSVCGVRERRRDALGVERRLEHDGREVASVRLPALVTATADAAPPAHVSQRRLREAHRQPIPAWELEWNGALPQVPRRGEELGLHRSGMMN